jgi:D-xylose transport system substrate-binding protein
MSVRFAHLIALSILSLAACGGGSSGVTLGKKIALLLPESTSSRDYSVDRNHFETKVKSLCSDCQVLSSIAKDGAEQASQATAAIDGGASVIVLDPIPGSAAGAIATQARTKNIPIISYDSLITNTADLSYFLSFDYAAVGTLQGTSLLEALASKTKPAIVALNGDANDSRAELFKQSAHGALDGKVTFGKEYATTGSRESFAEDEMRDAITALNRKVDGVLAANDAIAGGAVKAMKSMVMKPLPPVTGQGAELAAIQRILAGDQYMTVYEPIKAEAETAATLAYDLAFGVAVPQSLILGRSVNNGSADVPAVLVAPVAVTKFNIESTVVKDGFWTADQICTSQYASACAAAGVA